MFRRRDLSGVDQVYLRADGIHVTIRLEEHRPCEVVMVGEGRPTLHQETVQGVRLLASPVVGIMPTQRSPLVSDPAPSSGAPQGGPARAATLCSRRHSSRFRGGTAGSGCRLDLPALGAASTVTFARSTLATNCMRLHLVADGLQGVRPTLVAVRGHRTTTRNKRILHIHDQ